MKKIFLAIIFFSTLSFSSAAIYPVVNCYGCGSAPTIVNDIDGIPYADSSIIGDNYYFFGPLTIPDTYDMWFFTDSTTFESATYMNNNGGAPAFTGIAPLEDNTFTHDGLTIHAYRYNTSQCTGGCGGDLVFTSPDGFENTLGANRVYSMVVVPSGSIDVTDEATFCSAVGYTGCVAPTPPPAGVGAINDYIASSTQKDSFKLLTGFDRDSVVDYIKGLVLMFIGLMFSLIGGLANWAIAIFAITAIIMSAYGAFKFFRH